MGTKYKGARAGHERIPKRWCGFRCSLPETWRVVGRMSVCVNLGLGPDRQQVVDGPDVPDLVDQCRRCERPLAKFVGMEQFEFWTRSHDKGLAVIVGDEKLIVDDDRRG